MNKRYVIIATGIALVAVLFSAVGWQNYLTKDTRTPQPAEEVIVHAIDSEPSHKITYTSATYGYSFEYPSEWKVAVQVEEPQQNLVLTNNLDAWNQNDWIPGEVTIATSVFEETIDNLRETFDSRGAWSVITVGPHTVHVYAYLQTHPDDQRIFYLVPFPDGKRVVYVALMGGDTAKGLSVAEEILASLTWE